MAERILVVEDDPRLAEMLSEYLGGAGFRVTGAATGALAMQRLAEAVYDAIVLDLMLPDMDGSGVVPATAHQIRHPDPDAHRARRRDRSHRGT